MPSVRPCCAKGSFTHNVITHRRHFETLTHFPSFPSFYTTWVSGNEWRFGTDASVLLCASVLFTHENAGACFSSWDKKQHPELSLFCSAHQGGSVTRVLRMTHGEPGSAVISIRRNNAARVRCGWHIVYSYWAEALTDHSAQALTRGKTTQNQKVEHNLNCCCYCCCLLKTNTFCIELHLHPSMWHLSVCASSTFNAKPSLLYTQFCKAIQM